MGAFYAPTVVAGVHHMYTIIDLGQLAKFGVTYWLPLASAANVARVVHAEHYLLLSQVWE